MSTIEERLAQLEQQQALQTGALKFLIEGRWTGAMPNAAAQIDALMGGNAKDFAPLDFPKDPGA